MKLKIRGLVFTGFAATVFASSAMAVTPPSVQYTPPYTSEAETAIDTLKSTVTSKYYTNETFQTRTTVGSGESEDTLKVGRGEGEWAKLDTVGVGTDTTAQGYLELATDVNSSRGLYTLDIRDNKIVDDGTGVGSIAGADGSGPASTEAHDLTTAKAVYEFVTSAVNTAGDDYQPKVGSIQNPNTTIQVGYYVPAQGTQGEQGYVPASADWGTLTAKANTVASGVTTGLGYLEVSGSGGNYTMNIASGKIASDANAISTGGTATGNDALSSQDKLTTAKAVYDFVTSQTGDFQRKLNGNDPKSHAYVGVYVNKGTELEPDMQSEWYSYVGGPSSVDGGNVTYLGVTKYDDANNGKGEVRIAINDTKLTTTAAQVTAATAANGDLTDLVTVNALKQYVGNVTGGEIPPECVRPGVHCALVTVYVPADNTDPENPVSAHATTQWTVMAGAEAD